MRGNAWITTSPNPRLQDIRKRIPLNLPLHLDSVLAAMGTGWLTFFQTWSTAVYDFHDNGCPRVTTLRMRDIHETGLKKKRVGGPPSYP